MDPVLKDLLIAIGLLIGLIVSFELGFRLGRRSGRRAQGGGDQTGAVQGALLGLLGLLLGFSFAAAGGRFMDRQDLIVQEANAIGTASLRADLLPEPHAGDLRTALREYTRVRLEVMRTLGAGITREALAEFDRFHARMWASARAGVEARPAFALAVLDPVNSVIDVHATRLHYASRRLPAPVWALLLGASIMAVGVLGYGAGLNGCRRVPMTWTLTSLIGAALWITFDLDHPRGGLMQLNDAPLEALTFPDIARPAQRTAP